MYEKILVPLDGSSRAEKILPHVEQLAYVFKSKILLLQVIHPDPAFVGGHGFHALAYQEFIDTMMKEAENYLAGQEGVFREKGISASSLIEIRPSVGTIVKVAEREKVDLIALASHGHSGLASVFYGSVASGILNRVSKPLLMIRTVSVSIGLMGE